MRAGLPRGGGGEKAVRQPSLPGLGGLVCHEWREGRLSGEDGSQGGGRGLEIKCITLDTEVG